MMEKYVCAKCGKVAKTKQALERHAAYHEDVRPFSCEICLQRFKNSDDRGKHYRRLKKDGKFDIACQVCHKHFKSNDLLKKHVEILGCLIKSTSEDLEIGIKEIANVVVDKFSTLAKDVNNYSQDLQYGNSSFDSKNNIPDSTFNKTEVKCACKICQVPFSKVDDLKEHYHKVHNGSKRQVCIQCGQTLSSKDSLARHYSIFHQSDYPFQCDMCSQRFKIKEGLCRHMKFVHKDKGYPCEVCGRVFTQPVNLKKHMMLHNGTKEFKCLVCSREFRWKQAFHKHMLTHKFKNYISSEVDDLLQGDGHFSNKSQDDIHDQKRATEGKSEITVSVAVNENQDHNSVEYFAKKTEDESETDTEYDIEIDENDEQESVYKKGEESTGNMEVESETVHGESERSNKRHWSQNGRRSFNLKNKPESNISEYASDMFLKVLEFAEIVSEFGSKDIDIDNHAKGLCEANDDAESSIANMAVNCNNSDISNGKRRKLCKDVNYNGESHKDNEVVESRNKIEFVKLDKVQEPTHLKRSTKDPRCVDKYDEDKDAFLNVKVGQSRNPVKDKDESITTLTSHERMQTSWLRQDRVNQSGTHINMVTDEHDERLILKGLTSGPTDNAFDAPRLLFRPSLIHKILESPKTEETVSAQKHKTEINNSIETLNSKTVYVSKPSVVESDSRVPQINHLHEGTSFGKEKMNPSSTDGNNVLVKKFHIKVQQTSPQSSFSEKNTSSPSFSDPELNRSAKDVGEILNLSKAPDAGKFSLVKHMLSLKNDENFDQAIFRNPLYSTPLDVNGFKNLVERHKISDEDGDRLYDLSAKQNIPFLWLGMTKSNGKMVNVNDGHHLTKQSFRHPDKIENQQVASRPDQEGNIELLDTSSRINRENRNVYPPIKDCRNSGDRNVSVNVSGASTDAIMPPGNGCGVASVGYNDKVHLWLSKSQVLMEESVNITPTDDNEDLFSYDNSIANCEKEKYSKSSSAVSAETSKHSNFNAQYLKENCGFIAKNEELYLAKERSNISFSSNKLTGNHYKKSEININSTKSTSNHETRNDCFLESNRSNIICENSVDHGFPKPFASHQFSVKGNCAGDNVNLPYSVIDSGTMFVRDHHHLVSHASFVHKDLLHRQNSYPFSSNRQTLNASGLMTSTHPSANTSICLMRSQSEMQDKLLSYHSNNHICLDSMNIIKPNSSCGSLNTSLLTNNSVREHSQNHANKLLTDTIGEIVNRNAHHSSHIHECFSSQNTVTSGNEFQNGTTNIGMNNSKLALLGDVSILDLLDEGEKS
ncbi:uncharacterized protein LOC127865678 [Dreissena polymorpha]|uniref:C2H2-type domain-containing protein n=1 Tax=Dreissena polymorpha TaxID=45954 RepID=A0A9D4LMW4_DREPO|nr:uncharacterized protein LOC127865678 [Dreissena polymorpha]XP_052261562.1 uncharacterized protein LOC127865678 [Dreissena polymorpha]KAH3860487.1 hypothetical protein DPMN_023387 [Dreissena polymorpha]